MGDRSTAPVALVTGSSSGIGAAVARTFTADGYRVALNSATSVAAGQRLAAELPGSCYIQADIAEDEEAGRLVDAVIDRFGRLDVLVNNAGVTRPIPHTDLDSVTPQIWQDILAVNLIGTWQVTVAAVPHLRAVRGNVVNIASVAGVRPAGSSIPYAVSKAALCHLTRLLAAALGPLVRVNAVAPGLIDTPWTRDFADVRARVEASTPLRRVGAADEVAHAVRMLAAAEYTTGEVLLVDGGAHLIIG